MIDVLISPLWAYFGGVLAGIDYVSLKRVKKDIIMQYVTYSVTTNIPRKSGMFRVLVHHR